MAIGCTKRNRKHYINLEKGHGRKISMSKSSLMHAAPMGSVYTWTSKWCSANMPSTHLNSILYEDRRTSWCICWNSIWRCSYWSRVKKLLFGDWERGVWFGEFNYWVCDRDSLPEMKRIEKKKKWRWKRKGDDEKKEGFVPFFLLKHRWVRTFDRPLCYLEAHARCPSLLQCKALRYQSLPFVMTL